MILLGWSIGVPQPGEYSAPGRRAGGETCLQEVTAGRRFPVQHFASDKDAGTPPQHETSAPEAAKISAAIKPAGPAPMTAMRRGEINTPFA